MLTPQDSFNLVRGMSQELPAHLPSVAASLTQSPVPHWWYANNIRFRHGRLKQVPEYKLEVLTSIPDATDISVISAFSATSTSIPFVLSGKGLYVIDFGGNPGITNSQHTFFAQPMGYVEDTTSLNPWAHVETIAGVYYTNLLNPIIYFNGGVCAWNHVSGPDYKGKYLVNFYNHLVIANVWDGANRYPLRLAYSDIIQFGVFDPTISNEADFFDIPNSEQNSVFTLGITGLQQVGDLLAIYTPGSIWNGRYVGFDNGVMSFTRQIDGIGCWLPYSVVGIDRYNCFIATDDFYVYDGNTCQSIGGAIRDFFFSDLSTDPDIRNITWGILDIQHQEVRWYYPTKASTGKCDGCIVFNWQTRDWYTEYGFNKTAEALFGGSSNRYIDQLDKYSATITGLDAIASTIDGLDSFSIISKPLFSNAPHTIQSEYDDVIVPAQFPSAITLESRDYLLGTAQDVKEIETILVDAECIPYFPGLDNTNPNSDTYGWRVFVSARDYVNSPLIWVEAGLYIGTEPELRFTNLRVSGRIFRFKFISKNLAASHFYGFSPNFYAGATEK